MEEEEKEELKEDKEEEKMRDITVEIEWRREVACCR